MKVKKEESKNGSNLKMIENLSIITNKEIAWRDSEKLVDVTHEYITNLTHCITPQDYDSAPNEFIEMILATMAYASARLIIDMYEMYPEATIDSLKSNFNKSIEYHLKALPGI